MALSVFSADGGRPGKRGGITWAVPKNITADNDVSTNSTPLRAYVFGTQSLSGAINGVTFTRLAD